MSSKLTGDEQTLVVSVFPGPTKTEKSWRGKGHLFQILFMKGEREGGGGKEI